MLHFSFIVKVKMPDITLTSLAGARQSLKVEMEIEQS